MSIEGVSTKQRLTGFSSSFGFPSIYKNCQFLLVLRILSLKIQTWCRNGDETPSWGVTLHWLSAKGTKSEIKEASRAPTSDFHLCLYLCFVLLENTVEASQRRVSGVSTKHRLTTGGFGLWGSGPSYVIDLRLLLLTMMMKKVGMGW